MPAKIVGLASRSDWPKHPDCRVPGQRRLIHSFPFPNTTRTSIIIIMVSTQPALDGLSTDLLTIIITLLQFPDICSLRLVSRTLIARSSQAFEKHFRTKTLKWTSSKQLQEFVHLTQPNGLGCLLQRLTIVGVAPVTSMQHASTKGKLLIDAFTNLRLNSASGGLQSLVLRVEGQDMIGNFVTCEKIREWKPVWQTAALTFEISVRALAASALPVEELDIFNSVNRCSLACNKIAPILDSINLSKPLEKLKSLSLSLSLHVAVEDRAPETLSLASAKRHSFALSRLLTLCPQLEKLELHWYQIVPRIGVANLNEAQIEEQRFFTHVLKNAPFSQLRTCKLEGIKTDDTTLLAFVHKASELSSLHMEDVHLLSGKFGPVFDYITSQLRHLEYLHLDDLYESRMICFDGPGKPKMPTMDKSDGPTTLTRVGDGNRQRRRKIGYRETRGSPLGSQANRWINEHRLHYGPA
jgi:hypothetical protein